MPSILVSHPTGNMNVRQLLKSLNENDLLNVFYTTLGFSESSWMTKTALKKIIERRLFPIYPKQLHTKPIPEIIRLINRRLFPHQPVSHKHEIDKLYYEQDAYVAASLHKHRLTGLYAYEDGALKSFKAARNRGIITFYELPIAYWETAHRLLKEEVDRYPEWEPTLIATQDGQEKCERKTEELQLADYIICPSDFVKNTLPESILNTKKITTIPYGAPLPNFYKPIAKETKKRPLKILFAGSLTQRKGLADLFEAFKMLSQNIAHLTIVGTPIAPLSFYKKIFPHFTYYPSMPQRQLFELMAQHDLLALPSIIEGRALVQLEALGCGLPILITPHTGGTDLLQDQENGFLVPIRSPETIAQKITYLHDNIYLLPDLKKNAYNTAYKQEWSAYRQKITHFFQNLNENDTSFNN